MLITLILITLMLDRGWFGITLSVLLCLLSLFTIGLIIRNNKTQKEYLISYDGNSTHIKELTGLSHYSFNEPVKLFANLIIEEVNQSYRDIHYLVMDYPIEDEVNIELCYIAEIEKFYQDSSQAYLIKTKESILQSVIKIPVIK